ncbi:hypothetical protein QJS04_geneDACA016717 [Acorus gramineus]|uniref:Secreted protein n=1 Tax=Acorus gramineus TaxID=55184 RepID=A0AAV9ARH5_ACOGR|nr:hypothetical protein QJS04_geneDACA016717 [Acorus gramineus]
MCACEPPHLFFFPPLLGLGWRGAGASLWRGSCVERSTFRLASARLSAILFSCVCISNRACCTYSCIWTRLGLSQDSDCVFGSVIMFLIYRLIYILCFRIFS